MSCCPRDNIKTAPDAVGIYYSDLLSAVCS